MRASLLAIVGLSLAVWLYFYGYAPLAAEETVVVVLACALLVLGVRWLWSRALQLGRRLRHGR